MHLKVPTKPLTPRQMQLLRGLAESCASRCYSPTIQELADQLGISRATAFEHIAALREKALVRSAPGRARSLRLTRKGQELLERKRGPRIGRRCDGRFGIPLAGKVAAGVPIEAVENSDCFSVASEFGTSDDIFALRVTGESMIDEDIRDGDCIICRRASTAHNGQLVIAIIDNENATLKRFFKEPARVRLQSSNDNYPPIYSQNCRIEAVVLGLVRKF